MEKTIKFDEEVNGWVSFYSFLPEFMAGLNGKFFTYKNGDLHKHDSLDVPRNNFYGEQFTSKVSVVLNDAPSTEKMFKNIMLEGNSPWDIVLTSNLTNGTISKEEFEKKKSRYFAYTRRNENEADISSFSTNGIGVSTGVNATSIIFTRVNDMICIGDKLTQMQSDIPVEIGIITGIDKTTGEVSFAAFDNQPSIGDFCYASKSARIEGGEIRGYYLRVDLENDDEEFAELFAVTSNTAESYV